MGTNDAVKSGVSYVGPEKDNTGATFPLILMILPQCAIIKYSSPIVTADKGGQPAAL